MKRLLLAATAVIAVSVPLAAPAFADPPRSHRYEERYDNRDYDRRDYDRRDYDRRDYDRGDYRRDRADRNDHWRVGDRIGRNDYRYRDVDYRHQRLKAPPRGYHYVKDNNTGDIVLAVIATGIIAAIIAN